MASQDLLPKILGYLDAHIAEFVIEILLQKQRYNVADLKKERFRVLSKTKMLDSAIQLASEVGVSDKELSELQKKRDDVLNSLKAQIHQAKTISSLFKEQSFIENFSNDQQANLNYWISSGRTVEEIQILYDTGKFYYDCGNYENAIDYLVRFCILSSDTEKVFNAHYGKMECEYFISNFAYALEEFKIVREILEKSSSSDLIVLQRKASLLHWALFIFFQNENPFANVFELFMSEPFKQVVEIMCPHLLRYLTVAAINQKRKKDALQEVARLIQQESESYRDPITEFFEALYINLDFDAAEQKLAQCEEVLRNDFFLESHVETFFENARLFIFETYCKIHQRVDIGMLAQKLKMGSDEAEKWIVNLVRNAQLEAKIDSENNAVIMYQHTPNVYQQIIEKTKALSFRSHVIINNLKGEASSQDKSKNMNFRGRKPRQEQNKTRQ